MLIKTSFIHSFIHSTLKKPTLDASDTSDYRQISRKLSFLSKLVERCAYKQLNLQHHNLLPEQQSAY